MSDVRWTTPTPGRMLRIIYDLKPPEDQYGALKTDPITMGIDGMARSVLAHFVETLPGVGRNIGSGTWVAGGAVRRILRGWDPWGGDVDVFCKSMANFRELNAKMAEAGWEAKPTYAPSVVSLWQNPKELDQKINLIAFHQQPNPVALMKTFDFTCCQFATNGYALWMHEKALEDAKAYRLRPYALRSAASTLKRITKYAKYGFTLQPEDITLIAGAMPSLPEGIGEGDYG